MRFLTTQKRREVEDSLNQLRNGGLLSLSERITLSKYAKHYPFIANQLGKALKIRTKD